jgi:hypothetical protein
MSMSSIASVFTLPLSHPSSHGRDCLNFVTLWEFSYSPSVRVLVTSALQLYILLVYVFFAFGLYIFNQ